MQFPCQIVIVSAHPSRHRDHYFLMSIKPSPERRVINRRDFLSRTSSALGGSWIALYMPAILATSELACQTEGLASGFSVLSDDEARELDAVIARIIPSDETPGAREAGVLRFADLALDSFMARLRPDIVEGLSQLNAQGGASFSDLVESDQDARLRTIESTPFFRAVRFLTFVGFLAHPKYGGNTDMIGWRHIGFDDRHAWQPPFGFYDRPHHEGTTNE